MSTTAPPVYSEALAIAFDLIETPGTNPEYERGMVELLADLFPVTDMDTGERKEQIEQDLRDLARPTTSVELPTPTRSQQFVLDALRFPGTNKLPERHPVHGYGPGINRAIYELSRLGYLEVSYDVGVPTRLQITRAGLAFVPGFD